MTKVQRIANALQISRRRNTGVATTRAERSGAVAASCSGCSGFFHPWGVSSAEGGVRNVGPCSFGNASGVGLISLRIMQSMQGDVVGRDGFVGGFRSWKGEIELVDGRSLMVDGRDEIWPEGAGNFE
jgi:hypothetical protein